MPENKIYDYLIIGQGLAGSLLAWRLINEGKSVCVLDDGHASSSSMVAAGVINPLAGKRFNHSPHIHVWLEAVGATYTQLSRLAKQPFLQWVDMLRLFREKDQHRYYERLSGQENIQLLISGTFTPDHPPQPVAAPLGGFIQKHTGYVRIPSLLAFLADWLKARQALEIASVSSEDISVDDHGVRYGRLRAGDIIFCDGYRSMKNPWFGYLPFAPDKGEILTLQARPGTGSAQLPDMIINAATWLLPVDNGAFRLGSTHNHRIQDNQPAAEGIQALLEGMSRLLDHPELLTLEKSEAGVLPATSDRQPFLGTHPVHPQLHIFNGFGAHGSLTIPWYSQQMTAFLLEGKTLPENADIKRFARR
ncbi:NAD(P)/FAD-dependent oxidoreductase [Thiolapillus sp.]|uniref:NAD(P)/FAD-dependent oxidoreductase n=2 Tax=Thiolapillus sp. TaxID=2017437 RepID=UPI0025F43901|nr:FAD-binding oxidoreductase [Thiolapillus sp.]